MPSKYGSARCSPWDSRDTVLYAPRAMSCGRWSYQTLVGLLLL